MTSSADHDNEFSTQVAKVAKLLGTRFPDNAGVSAMVSQLPMLAISGAMKSYLRTEWRTVSILHRFELVTAGNAHVAIAVFDGCPNPQLKSLGLAEILKNPDVEQEFKDELLSFISLLTILSHKGTDTDVMNTDGSLKTPPPAAATTMATPAAPAGMDMNALMAAAMAAAGGGSAAAAATGGATAAKRPDMKQAMEGLIESMPKLVETFNGLMKDDDGSNVFAQLAKQFTNPGQLQPGVANNVAANYAAMNAPDESVMSQVTESLAAQGSSMSADDVMERLARLDKLEKLRAKRRK